MRISLRIFWTPKRGNTAEEYEDAFWPPAPLDLDSKLFRFAVADGATETSFARSWAQLLTRAYCRDYLSEKKIRKHLPQLEQQWNSSIGKAALPWYAEEKLSHGAFATVLGLTVLEGTWQSTAIGDSCLFQVRDGRLLTAFPMTEAGDFNNRPPLLSSNKRNWNDELAHICRAQGTWQPNDVFYLMTDAIACWFLQCSTVGALCERASAVIDRAYSCAGEFEESIESLRDAGMRNDDVTLLRISVQ
ncbi:MAG TPA: protein phosphatase 2C domain-containing protein [Terriglobia bacterium]|jgi:hypothetical protein